MTILTFKELSFELRESPRRRTVEIAIERDGSLVLVTPPHVPQEELERIVEQRRFWIYSKLIKKESFKAPTGTKTYLPGEGFYYLGLLVVGLLLLTVTIRQWTVSPDS